MSIILNIPDSVARGLRLPENEVESRLRMELSVALYAQGILSFGKAAELANVSRFLFADPTGYSTPLHRRGACRRPHLCSR
jgi:predicted HTH domain antitoxin